MSKRSTVLLLLLIAVSGCRAPAVRERDGKLDRVRPVQAPSTSISSEGDTGFMTGGWRFIWRARGEIGYPVEASLGLTAERDGKVVHIDRPGDVHGLPGVRILTSDQALRFARIFTLRDTYYRFLEPGAFEFPSGCARVETGKRAFVITRRLLFTRELAPFNFELSRADYFPLYEVRETVLPDGRYMCKKLRVVEWVEKCDAHIPRIQ